MYGPGSRVLALWSMTMLLACVSMTAPWLSSAASMLATHSTAPPHASSSVIVVARPSAARVRSFSIAAATSGCLNSRIACDTDTHMFISNVGGYVNLPSDSQAVKLRAGEWAYDERCFAMNRLIDSHMVCLQAADQPRATKCYSRSVVFCNCQLRGTVDHKCVDNVHSKQRDTYSLQRRSDTEPRVVTTELDAARKHSIDQIAQGAAPHVSHRSRQKCRPEPSAKLVPPRQQAGATPAVTPRLATASAAR